MLPRHAISADNWERIKDLLPGKETDPGATAKDNRLFLDAVLWSAKTGAPWRDLPERFGHWNSVWKRFNRWAHKGPLAQALRTIARSRPGVAHPRLHQHSRPPTRCRRCKKSAGSGGQEEQALGRSRGGFSTKIHTVVSGLGLPVVFIVSAGQEADVSYAETLLQQIPAETQVEVVRADKGYDSQQVVEQIEATGAEAVIPTQKNRKVQRVIDAERYKDRNLVERFWSKAKQFRRVATRYEKTARNFRAFVHVAAIMILLQ
jgi:transposase